MVTLTYFATQTYVVFTRQNRFTEATKNSIKIAFYSQIQTVITVQQY